MAGEENGWANHGTPGSYRFNEAPARWPGKSSPRHSDRKWSGCGFNEAPARWPGKSEGPAPARGAGAWLQ